jgi:hypothetical protein
MSIPEEEVKNDTSRRSSRLFYHMKVMDTDTNILNTILYMYVDFKIHLEG